MQPDASRRSNMGICADADPPAQRDGADAVQQYVAFAAGGQVEDIAARELEWTFGLRCGSVQSVALPPLSDQWAPDLRERVFPGEAGVAKLRFVLPRPADAAGWSRQRRLFASLKCTQSVLALVCVESGLPFEKEAALGFLADVIARAEGWDGALVAWWHHLGPGWRERTHSGHSDTTVRPAFPASPPCLSFRGSSIRDGQHQYRTVDMTPAVGRGTLTRFPAWRVDLRGFEVEVLAVALQRELVVGVSLSSAPRGAATSTLPAEPRPLLPRADVRARLRSSTAALMLACAVLEEEDGDAGDEEAEARGAVGAGEPRATGDAWGSPFETWGSGRRVRRVQQPPAVVIDPMCGVGTIPLEAMATLSCHWLRGPACDGHGSEEADSTGAGSTDATPPEGAGAARACAGWGGVFSLGGDVEPGVVAQAALNAAVLGHALQMAAVPQRQGGPDASGGTGGASGAGEDEDGGGATVCLDRAAAEVEANMQTAAAGPSPAVEEALLVPLPGWHYAERVYGGRRCGPAGAGGGAMGTCVWDATAMPVRSGVADAVVCDPPFGISHKVRHGAHVVYTRLFAEAARVLRTGGRLVALTPCRAPLARALADTAPLWRNVRTNTINCGGMVAILVICSRTDEPLHRHWDRDRRRPVHAQPAAPGAGGGGVDFVST